jgi:hypothetical protein
VAGSGPVTATRGEQSGLTLPLVCAAHIPQARYERHQHHHRLVLLFEARRRCLLTVDVVLADVVWSSARDGVQGAPGEEADGEDGGDRHDGDDLSAQCSPSVPRHGRVTARPAAV